MTTARIDPTDATGGRIVVAMTGSCDGLEELRAALLEEKDVEFLGWREHVREAVPMLATSHLQVVLHATRGTSLFSKELAAIREHTRAPIVMLASRKSPIQLQAALESNVADLVLLPQSAENVVFAARKAIFSGRRQWGVDEKERGGGRVFTVFSPKGGTGKSVVATNMAIAFAAAKNRRVLLIDLDLQFGDASIMLGLKPEKTLHDLVAAPGDLDSEKLAGFVIRHPSGLDVVAAPLRPDEAEFVTEHKIANLLAVAQYSYDAIVVDTSPFFYGPMLATLDNTDELMLICVPEVPTLKNAYLTLRTLELLSFPTDRIRLVLNRVDLKEGIRKNDVEETLGAKISFLLPDDRAVPRSLNQGRATVLAQPGASFSRALLNMIGSLATTLRQDGREPPAVESAVRRPAARRAAVGREGGRRR